MNDRLSPLQLPDGSGSVVRVHAIDTTLKMYCKAAPFLTPLLNGFEHINFPTYAFLIHNTKLDRKVLFDLGGRKDYWNYSPTTLGLIRASSAGMRMDKNIDDILLDRGIALDSLEAVIWSHGHFDHIGDCSKFPPSVKIVVGEGFKKASLPGFPSNPRSVILESDYGGRDMEEVDFHESLKIGRFRAHDYFGDRSFYLLDVPGHAPGHMCGLVRTTPNSFCLLGADTCHIAGCFRPSPSVPLPKKLSERDGLDRYFPSPCPCSAFTALHPNADLADDTKSTTKYFKASNAKGAAFFDPNTANWSIDGLEEFDALDDVWILLAHDTGLLGVLPMLNDSDEDIGDWKTKGWKEDTRWRWLNELPRDGRPGREQIVKGFWRNGVEVPTFDG